MTLPKMKPCSKCGKEPQWCTGWDSDSKAIAKVAIWLHCECRFIKRSLHLAEAMDESKVYDAVHDIADKWWMKEWRAKE